MNIGKGLMAEVSGSVPEKGHALLWWLGQHSFIVKIKDRIIYVDPYLSDNPRRLISPFFKAEELVNADIVLGTHDHSDHIDRPLLPIIAKSSPGAIFVVPESVRQDIVTSSGIDPDRIIGMNDLVSREIASVKITALASAHELLHYDEKTGLYPFLGYVIEYDGVTVYHSGDCCIYEGIVSKLKKWNIDVALLPINGRDAVRYARNCIGNMTFQEAADLAGSIAPRLSIPTHYDMFSGNRENPANFTDYMKAKYPELKTLIPKYATAFSS